MPLYEFEEVGTGRRVELFRKIAERDLAPDGFRRVLARPARCVSVPTHNLYTGQARDPGEAHLAVPRAFRELEQTMGADRIAREAGFSVKDIKQAWFEDRGDE